MFEQLKTMQNNLTFETIYTIRIILLTLFRFCLAFRMNENPQKTKKQKSKFEFTGKNFRRHVFADKTLIR